MSFFTNLVRPLFNKCAKGKTVDDISVKSPENDARKVSIRSQKVSSP